MYTVTDEELEEAVKLVGNYPIIPDAMIGEWSTVEKEITKEVVIKVTATALWQFARRLEARHHKEDEAVAKATLQFSEASKVKD